MSENGFEEARRETVRYHRELYASASLGQPGTWLAGPSGLLDDVLVHVRKDRPLVAYDLGAGIGRHTIPMLRLLPKGSEVVAVDLLPEALRRLEASVPEGVRTTLRTVAADLLDFEFDRPADLVLAFSAIEHLPDVSAIRRLLDRIARATAGGGAIAIGVVADRAERTDDGARRPALLESQVTSTTAQRALSEAFAGFDVQESSLTPTRVREARGNESYWLESTLVRFIATKPVSMTRG